jgi:methionyl-tRNA formyltransferase
MTDRTTLVQRLRADWDIQFPTPKECADELDRQVRALNPSPMASTELGGLAVNIVAAHPVRPPHAAPPGRLLHCADDGLVLACGDGALKITKLQPAGKRPMTAREFVNGYRKHLDL